MKDFKKVYLLIASNKLNDYTDCVFEKKEDAENYAKFLINSDLAKNTIVRPIKYWKEIKNE